MNWPPADNDRRHGAAGLLFVIAALRAWIFLVALLAFFEIWAQIAYGNSFLLNTYSLQAIGMAAVAPLLLGLGQTFVIISGGIDLSVGFIMGLSAVVSATVMRDVSPTIGHGPGLALGIGAGIAIATVPGWINGTLISRLGVPPFIGTLGMFGVARGAGFLLADGTTVPARNEYLNLLGNERLWGVPVQVILVAVAILVFHLLLSQTRFGQYTYALGGNRQAALRAGVEVRRHTLMLYILSATSAALAGVLYTARYAAGAPHAGEPLLLDSIAAVVIGGASLFGGSGTIIGTVIGALIIAVIQFGLVFINVKPFWQFIAVGVVIIISVLVDQSQRRLTGGRQDE